MCLFRLCSDQRQVKVECLISSQVIDGKFFKNAVLTNTTNAGKIYSEFIKRIDKSSLNTEVQQHEIGDYTGSVAFIICSDLGRSSVLFSFWGRGGGHVRRAGGLGGEEGAERSEGGGVGEESEEGTGVRGRGVRGVRGGRWGDGGESGTWGEGRGKDDVGSERRH